MDTPSGKCWAHDRGDCARGISREHLISKALLPDQMVYVSGFKWCRDEERKVGINSLQRRFLCQKHNNDLSPADEAGVRSVEAFSSGKSQSPINGFLFERWLLKTAINLHIDSGLSIGCGMADSIPGRPNPYLLAVAFGELPFLEGMGAYFALPKEFHSYRPGEIAIAPLHKDGEIGGILFALRGQLVFLSLFPGHSPPAALVEQIISECFSNPQDIEALAYRPSAISVEINGGEKSTIHINW